MRVKFNKAISFWYYKMCNFTFWATDSTACLVLITLFLWDNSCGQ